ncbi:ExeA family protein [Malonomonas rubra]|uniref:ExeA family protein n=1 Tax=Malonomonas rubra TaxID=57040 RepID=UPI0026EB955D|nr:ExeA family protein [Malonomonas rubra]
MYLKMYGFEEKPFHITPNPRFIFLSKIHKEAFAHLLYGIQQRVGFMSLSGEIGTGKTTVLRTLLSQLEEGGYCVALIFNPCLTAIELLQIIHREFGIVFDPESSNLVTLHESLNHYLLQQREVGKTVVLVVDEAQNLDPKVLEQLRLLSNLETETEKLIQMILVGQPELDELLQRQDLRQLKQRVAVSYHLQPMDKEDTIHYIQHRLRVAGNTSPALFDPQGLTQIYNYTQGTPRLINILCDRALLVAYGRDAQKVSRQDVKIAQDELRQHKIEAKKSISPIAVAGAMVLFLALFFIPVSMLETNPQLPETDLPAAVATELQAVPVEKPVLTEATVKPEQVAELVRQIDAIGVSASAEQSLREVAQAWGKEIRELAPIRTRGGMTNALAGAGFDLLELQATTDELLLLDAPVVLELSLPNVVGKRFLSLNAYLDGQFNISPAITSTGWLDVAALKEIWFGKAFLPYINYQEISFIDQPGKIGSDVSKLQTLLSGLQEFDVPINSVYDRTTIDAVTQFQRKVQLDPDGRVGNHTLFWLYRQAGYKIPRLKEEGK